MAPEGTGIDLGIEGIADAVRVGQGSFGAVYRAEQPRFRRTVAVKVISTPSLDEESRRVFERECQALGTLSGHPHIVTLYGAGITADDHPYLIMDFLPGGSLGERLASGRLGWQDATSIGVRLAGALATAHAAGILHRDIKPENVLLSAYGEPQLADFGVAKLQGGTRTTMGMITGSVAHAAPEVLSGRPATPASDVWSLASTVATLLAGTAPFHRDGDESLHPLLMRIMTGEPLDLRPLGVPDEVYEVITAALAKDSWDRTPTAVAFGEGLEDAQRRLGVAVTPMALPRAGAPPTPDGAPQPVRFASGVGLDQVEEVAIPAGAGAGDVDPAPVAPRADEVSAPAASAGREAGSGEELEGTRRRAPAPVVVDLPPAGSGGDKKGVSARPAPTRRHRLPVLSTRQWWTVAGVAAAVVVVVLGVVALSGGGGKKRAVATAPGTTPTTTPAGASSTAATKAPAPAERVVFQDDFKNPASGWAPDLNQADTGTSSYQPDGLHVVVPKPFPNPLNAFSVASPVATRLASLSMTATVTFLSAAPNDGAGLRCDQGDRAHLRYSFEVHPNGNWVIFKLADNGAPTALAQGSNPTVIAGVGGSNLMTATCAEAPDGTTRLGMIVNSVSLGTASDAHPQPIAWHTGLIAYRSTTTQATEVRFNSFRLVDTSTS